jgi:glycosyltransferase involved in cell wall biosynthesis
VTVHNGIELSGFEPASALDAAARAGLGLGTRAPVLGVLARLTPDKGITHLLKALPSLTREWPEMIVLVAGQGSEREALEAEAAALGVADNVRFLGQRSDVVNVLRAVDLLVLPSERESFPLVLLEAMAMRRAAVATDVGGVSEAVIDGETGFVVPPRDPGALGAAIARALREGNLERMGAAGRSRVETHFTAKAMAEKTTALYRTVLEETARRRGP